MHDLIIVGAGTAGCVLAEQLSASGRLRVVLVEAGGSPSSLFVRMPAGFAKLFKSKLDWNFQSEPQTAAGGRCVYIPRGKMLGGSSNINGQVHQWCHPADFDEWVAQGATGWGWSEVAPVFSAQENYSGRSGRPRGRSGPMRIAPNAYAHPLTHAFVAAARTCGLDGADDYNGGDYTGAWLAQLAHDRGQRFSCFDAYLKPALRRPNLQVISAATVTGILFESGRASGVKLIQDGQPRELKAGAGVILAAGAIGSPHLLLHSGIGPAAQLRQFSIPVLHDAPEVGANLQDHPIVPLCFRTVDAHSGKSAGSLGSLVRFLLFRRGMLASNGIEAIAFASSSQSRTRAPDIELIMAPFEWRNQALEPPQVHAYTVGVAVVAPHSRGQISLRSPDPQVPPAIDLGLLNDPAGVDAQVLLEGIALARRIVAAPPLAAMTAQAHDPAADCAGPALRNWINSRIQTVYHPSSTCRMGSDGRAVVSPALAVRGVDGLWVADASVMPTLVRGHPNAVVAMIAQRASVLIQQALPR